MLPQAENSFTPLPEWQLRTWLASLNDEERRAMKLLWVKYVPTNGANAVNRFANGIRNELRDIGAQFKAGRITQQEWYDETRRLMKLSYIQTIQQQDGQADRSKIVEAIIIYFLLLNAFGSGIWGGDIPLDGHVPIRTGMYGSAVYSVAKNWTLQSLFGMGYECRRVLGPNENHCESNGDTEGCPELAAKGWMPVEDVIPIGEATCGSNCRCSLEYRKKE